MASLVPVPPPLPKSRLARELNESVLRQEGKEFSLVGATKNNSTFEFSNIKSTSSIPLRNIVRQYLSLPQAHSIPAQQLYLILGRLRCLHYTVCKYNEGVSAPTPVFLQYWRQRALNLLSGFGFQVKSPGEVILITGLEELIQMLEDLYYDDIENARKLIKGGQIVFEALNELYRPEDPIQGRTSLGGIPGVFLVVDSYYEERRSLVGMEKTFHWSMEFIASMGDHFTVVRFSETLSGWTGVRARSLVELNYVPLKPAEVPALKERGDKYSRLGGQGAKFLAYSPHSFFLHTPPSRYVREATASSMASSGSSQLPTGGRVMIDVARGARLGHHASQGIDEATQAMINQAGLYRRWKNTQSASGATPEMLVLWETVPQELAICCWPALVGFSFSAKAWGHVLVDALEPISFRDEAFDRLVLSEERKQLIHALVHFGTESDTDDIIGGKHGGSIFLLHGPPGVGKTLTAEAVAEVLHRPLYYVTMGELGMTPEDMERRLNDVLELCAEWNAITLLDEADVFLEQRSTSDIVRNAMVCVMLRLLEYHSGILFLTTNRVRTFDAAFESRVTIALRYEPLGATARAKIWKNLVERVSIDVSTKLAYEDLAKYVLNGRQIKNAVRLAVALAKERGDSVLTQEILQKTLHMTSIGRQEMKDGIEGVEM